MAKCTKLDRVPIELADLAQLRAAKQNKPRTEVYNEIAIIIKSNMPEFTDFQFTLPQFNQRIQPKRRDIKFENYFRI